jgi:winged helix-turn-helix DNA-binding protein
VANRARDSSADAWCDAFVDHLPKGAHDGCMNRPTALEQRVERQSAELLAIILTEPRISTAEMASRTGMSDGVVRKRLAYLRSAGKITGTRGRLQPVRAPDLHPPSLEERVGIIERLLQKFLSRHDIDVS